MEALEHARAYLRRQGLTAQPRTAPPPGAGAEGRVGTSPRGLVPASLAPETPAGAAYAATHRLLGNPDDIGARRDLKANSAALLEHYLAGRGRAARSRG